MAGANTLAYDDTTTITAVKSFIVQAPRVKRQKNSFFEKRSSHGPL
jgi:hypothetical protein